MDVYRFSQICEINPKKEIELDTTAEITFLPMESVSVDGRIDSSKTISVSRVKNYSVFRDGDILFAKITPCMENGKGAVATNLKNGYGAGSTEFIVLRPIENVTAKWIYYFLSQKQFRWYCQQNMTGSAGQKRVPANFLANCEIPVPPLEEQKHIVSKIEELFSELDNGIGTLKKIKQQLAVYRQAVLKDSFGAITQFVPLGKITVSRLGKMLDREKNTGVLQPYLRNINVRWFSFDLSDLLEMRIEPEENEKYSVAKGDLIICEGGEPGRCAIWEQEETMFYQKALHRVRFINGSNPKFYMYYLWFAAQTGKLNPYFTGMGIKHLTGQSLVKVPVPNATIEQQNLAIQDIESKLSVCDSIEKTVDTALQQAEAMRQSILKKAFEGEL